MYALKPPSLTVLQEVLDDPAQAAVYERLQAALPAETPVQIVTEAELPELVMAQSWESRCRRMGMPPPEGDPLMFVGRMRWDGQWPRLQETLKEKYPGVPLGVLYKLYGYDAFTWFNSCQEGEPRLNSQHVCRPAWRLHLMWGCPHKCFYCGCTGIMTAMVNFAQYRRKLEELVERNPWELTWLYEDDSEALALEPEYGAMQLLAEYFGSKDDRYLIVHTKSANVDFLQDLDHRGHTILVWSLTPRTQSTLMEPLSGTMEERIEAAAKVDQWGYTARFKFKPIVPVVNWREELAEMIKLVFERSRPDNISLFTLAWMTHADLLALADRELLDPWALSEAEQAAPEMAAQKVGPFPHHVRQAIYEFAIDEIRRHDRDIPITLSTESGEMWRELGPKLGAEPSNYVCGCGPQATPWRRRLSVNPWQVAKPVPVDEE